MDAYAPACPSCAAPLASDQTYCLRCGSPRAPARPAWRRPLLAAAISLTFCAVAFAVVLSLLGDQAEDEASAQRPPAIAAAGAG